MGDEAIRPIRSLSEMDLHFDMVTQPFLIVDAVTLGFPFKFDM